MRLLPLTPHVRVCGVHGIPAVNTLFRVDGVESCDSTPVLHIHVKDRWSFYGDERNRTADFLLARQVLSQLSYAPFK